MREAGRALTLPRDGGFPGGIDCRSLPEGRLAAARATLSGWACAREYRAAVKRGA